MEEVHTKPRLNRSLQAPLNLRQAKGRIFWPLMWARKRGEQGFELNAANAPRANLLFGAREKRMRYYCRRDSAGSPLSTNLQLYSLKKAQKDWNDLVKLSAASGLNGAHDLTERLAFIVSCLGLSLSQLLGQNPTSPDKDKVDPPGKLLQNILVSSHLDQTTRRRLNSTFQEFVTYYDSVRHFGRSRDERHYRTIDRLTMQELDRFCRMTLNIWDTVIEIYRAHDQNDFRGLGSISEEVPFEVLPNYRL